MNPSSPEPYRECPRFPRCSVNRCPLDPEYSHREPHPGDPERRCGVAKAIRLRIAKPYAAYLPLAGLTAPEHAARQRWDNLSPVQRQAVAEMGRKSLLALTSKTDAKAGKTP